jgi:arylsulfatase A-like enzyme
VGSCTLNTNNKRTCYKAAVEAMDHYTGVLLDGLTSRGLLDSTIVIFVGDNGTPGEVLDAGFNTAHGKGTVYQTGVHVPLVVSGPRVVNPGRVVDALVNTTDLFNTVAELAGGAPTSGTDSVTLLPYLEDVAHPSPRTFAYTEVFTGTTPRNGSAAARDATYKLVESAGVAVGFYDLSTDPDEAVNLWPGACASLATVPAQTACTTLQTIIDGNE